MKQVDERVYVCDETSFLLAVCADTLKRNVFFLKRPIVTVIPDKTKKIKFSHKKHLLLFSWVYLLTLATPGDSRCTEILVWLLKQLDPQTVAVLF
jgi:hypothetical protein